MSQIIPNLFLSPVETSRNAEFIQKNNIKRILICALNLKASFPNKIIYHRLPIRDNPTTVLMKHFIESFVFIEEGLHGNSGVLVHC